jgi:hypothetical protein
MSRFPLGQLVATRGALAAMNEGAGSFWPYITRHSKGDWGDVCLEDLAENELSLKHGFRLLSAYTLTDGGKIWIITEAARSSTTILTPEEY